MENGGKRWSFALIVGSVEGIQAQLRNTIDVTEILLLLYTISLISRWFLCGHRAIQPN